MPTLVISSDFLYVSALSMVQATGLNTLRIQRIGSIFGVPASDSVVITTVSNGQGAPGIVAWYAQALVAAWRCKTRDSNSCLPKPEGAGW
jgi:hypothetical protein